MKIIAFGHQKGVGKDTAARFLDTILRIKAPKLKVKHISFAGKLKDISFQLFGWAGIKPAVYYESHPECKEHIIPELNMSARDIWIDIGNKMREVYPTVWLDYALGGIKADVIIISDLRFVNEANAVRAAGGTLIKIVRPDLPRGTDLAETSLLDWEDWDQVIANGGTLEGLNKMMEKLAEGILSD
jgi:hypothetical protein